MDKKTERSFTKAPSGHRPQTIPYFQKRKKPAGLVKTSSAGFWRMYGGTRMRIKRSLPENALLYVRIILTLLQEQRRKWAWHR